LFSIITTKLLHGWSEDEKTNQIPLKYVGLIVMEVTKVSRQKKDENHTVCGRFQSDSVGESWVSTTSLVNHRPIIKNYKTIILN